LGRVTHQHSASVAMICSNGLSKLIPLRGGREPLQARATGGPASILYEQISATEEDKCRFCRAYITKCKSCASIRIGAVLAVNSIALEGEMHFCGEESRTAMTAEVYGQAYQRGFDGTIRLLLSRGAQSECAREAAQAAWAKGWERINQLRNESLLTTWVNTIALNCYRNIIRREKQRLPLTELPTGFDVNLAAIDLERFLAWCRPSDRQLFEDYLQGYPVEEIARNQGISYTAVRLRLLRARRSLQAITKKRNASVRSNRMTAATPDGSAGRW
jgi:DNA-directed RNA polymerase specialized sigma24 family protein